MFKNFKLVAQPSRLHTEQTTNFMFVESTRQPSLSIIGGLYWVRYALPNGRYQT